MGNILEKIIEHKIEEIREHKTGIPISELNHMIAIRTATRNFGSALFQTEKKLPAVIAEVKKASPSKGLIRPDFDPMEIARAYENGGASAISVLTDVEFFQGSLDYLTFVKGIVNLPVLRKDFIVDEYQVYEARAAGADAILLIVAALEKSRLVDLQETAKGIGLQCLVEVHDEDEMQTALDAGSEIVGINNRNLKTFDVSLETTQRIIMNTFGESISGRPILVSESGIFSREDLIGLSFFGVDAVLIGEALVKESDIESKLKELLG